MKNNSLIRSLVLSVLVLVSTVFMAVAQPVQVTRGPQTPTITIERVFKATKGDTVTTDTVTSDVVALKGTLYSTTTDTVHRFVGYVRNVADTCTYTIAYQDCTAEGTPITGAAWTNLAYPIALVLLPNRFARIQQLVNVSTQYVRFRVIRGKGSTQSVYGSVEIHLFRY